jgi:chemotaxis protein MotB
MSDEVKKDTGPNGPPVWMLSLADLISLLLTFFVMLFAMSKVKIDRWDEVVDALSQSIKPAPKEENDEPMASLNIPRVYRKPAMNLDYLSAVIDDAIDDNPVLGDARMSRDADKLVISLPGDILFVSGSSDMTPKAKQALFVLGGVLRNIGNRIGVQGHTDPRPLSGRGAICLELGTVTGPCRGSRQRVEKIGLHRLHKYLRICGIKVRPASEAA